MNPRSDRSCALWLSITQGGLETMYKIKTERTSGVVRRILYKYIEGAKTSNSYVVEESVPGVCSCSCPDWMKHQEDCKHIIALRLNDLLTPRKSLPSSSQSVPLGLQRRK